MARPREFDKDAALRKALDIFWAKGFEGTSIADLTEGMNLSRSSLYETFGDKETLFCEAMTRYLTYTDRHRADILTQATSVKLGLAELLGGVIRFVLSHDHPGGCFLTNTATALGTLDERVQTIVKAGIAKLEDDLFRFFEQGKQRGELSPQKDSRALARFFVGLVRGISVLARVEKNPRVFEDMVKVALEVLK